LAPELFRLLSLLFDDGDGEYVSFDAAAFAKLGFNAVLLKIPGPVFDLDRQALVSTVRTAGEYVCGLRPNPSGSPEIVAFVRMREANARCGGEALLAVVNRTDLVQFLTETSTCSIAGFRAQDNWRPSPSL
jgi:hypothetical protein